MIKAKLYMNVHLMVLYKLYVFCSDMKFKMAATAGLSLTLDPVGEMFENASSLKPLEQLKPNCPIMIIARYCRGEKRSVTLPYTVEGRSVVLFCPIL
jgi:hypothetical protein